jgi:hypothetical protein
VSKQELSTSAAGVIGPGVAGALVQLMTAPVTLLLDALSYLLSALCVSLIQVQEAPPAAHGPHETLWQQVGAGLHFVLGHPLLRAIVLSGALLNFFSNVFLAVYLLFLVQDVHFSPVLVGLLAALRSGGFLLGALVTPWAVRDLGAGSTLMIGVLLMGGVWLPFPFL